MQRLRPTVQFGFLALILFGVFVAGAHCERWCPFGGLETLYTYVTEGSTICSVGTSNFFMLGGLILLTLALRRVFCSHVCPIGTISEHTGSVGRRLGLKPWRVPPAVDRVLRLAKYPILVAILYLTWRAGELIFRGFDPCYALISRHGEDITFWAYVVFGGIVVGSLVLALPFCRWLCPLAAVINPLSRIGWLRVRRRPEACTACGACSRACPVGIEVENRQQVSAARCTLCGTCIDSCPQARAGALYLGGPGQPGRPVPRSAVVFLLLACIAASVGAAYLFPLPSFVKSRGEPPEPVASVALDVENLTCRGTANRLWFFLERDDLFALDGYIRLEAWPGPGTAPIRVVYDPATCDPDQIRRAITEPYFNLSADTLESRMMESPFVIEGYDPLAAPLDLPETMPLP